MDLVKLRKTQLLIEEIHHEFGPPPGRLRLRGAIAARLTARGERVGACRTLREASDALAVITDRAAAPLVIISPVGFTEGDGISFYISARRRFPDIRWLVSLPPSKRTASAQESRLTFSPSRPPTAESTPQTRG